MNINIRNIMKRYCEIHNVEVSEVDKSFENIDKILLEVYSELLIKRESDIKLLKIRERDNLNWFDEYFNLSENPREIELVKSNDIRDEQNIVYKDLIIYMVDRLNLPYDELKRKTINRQRLMISSPKYMEIRNQKVKYLRKTKREY